MGWREASDSVRTSLQAAIKARRVTYDLARQIEGATEVKCSEFAEAIVAKMKP
jgi:isocitrate dehydrogenase